MQLIISKKGLLAFVYPSSMPLKMLLTRYWRIQRHTQLVGDEVRHKLLIRFPYSILYVIEPDRIRVVAVAHQKRRPGYWSYRL